MRKEDCEYCADEPSCKSKRHSMDCIFCECQSEYDTNFTCDECEHDMARCICSPEVVNRKINELIRELGIY